MRLAVLGMILALARSQTTPNSCLPNNVLTDYGLAPQTGPVNANGTCYMYWASNGRCVTPSSVISEMNKHNAYVARKALEAQTFALQYVNQTVYFLEQGNSTYKNREYKVDGSWFGSLTLTFDDWWTSVQNRVTAIFKDTNPWWKSVFTTQMLSIPRCMQAWANITNGAYCLAASSQSHPFRTNMTNDPRDLAWGVDRGTTAAGLAMCEPLINTYCLISYGISIYNKTGPFNTAINWTDGGLSQQTCETIRQYIDCNGTASCIQGLQDTYLSMFESHFVPFVPSNVTQKALGDFLAKGAAPGTLTLPQAVRNGRSFRIYAAAERAAHVLRIGNFSGQAPRHFIVRNGGSLVPVVTIFLTLLFASST